jgi:hypothetical protein
MMFPFTNGLIRTHHFDCEMAFLADRHYSRQSPGARQFAGNGEKIVLRDAAGLVLFVWLNQRFRKDRLYGYNNQWFRNESNRLSSEIILEGETFAVQRWGPGQAFTMVDPRKIRSSNPGCCYKKAGWELWGCTVEGKLIFKKFLNSSL